jgi:hypothetical protein
MAELFRTPFFQVENSAGTPVSGAKLYFYSAGTTTDLAVYQEIGLTTPHAQPVVADASGIFAAIYLGTATYKVVLKTAAGVTIQTWDNINSTRPIPDDIHGQTAKTTPVDADEFLIWDSVASLLKKLTWANLEATMAAALATPTDSTFRVIGSSDSTKKLAFEVDGFTAGQTRTATPPDSSFKIAALDVADQVITGGARVTASDLGTITTGTVTLDPGDRPHQYYINGGAHTLAPGSNGGAVTLQITNNASAGAVTTSGYTKVVGAFTTTNGDDFLCTSFVINGFSLLTIQALQ